MAAQNFNQFVVSAHAPSPEHRSGTPDRAHRRSPRSLRKTPSKEAAPVTQLLSLRRVAERLDISVSGVRRLIDKHELPIHRVGEQLRIAHADLEAYIRRSRIEDSGLDTFE